MRRVVTLLAGLVVLFPGAGGLAAGSAARELGVPLQGQPGELNAITDVRGVTVGHVTLIAQPPGPDAVRTGVTAVLPQGADDALPVAAAVEPFNGNGEMTGTHWINESGWLSGPVMLTNTHSVGAVHEGVIRWSLQRWGAPVSLPVVAETWDGLLNDIDGFHVRPDHAIAALNAATPGPVAEGSVGGGTGMRAFGFKSGIGTASRLVAVRERPEPVTVGVLVQANFGRREQLVVAGVPVGRVLAEPRPVIHQQPAGEGSCIILIATDAPLLPAALRALARRGMLGLARVGATSLHSSGDFSLAFSTARPDRAVGTPGLVHLTTLPLDTLDPVLGAVVEATEEAVLNALLSAETMSGLHGNILPALPRERLRELLERAERPVPATAP